MKKLVLFLLFFWIICPSQSQSFGLKNWYHVRQIWKTWCGHATVEMLSRRAVWQEESATYHGFFNLGGPYGLDCFDALNERFFKYCVPDAGVTAWDLLDIIIYFNRERQFADDRFDVVATFDQIFGISKNTADFYKYLPTVLCIISLNHAVLLLGFDSVILNGEYVNKLRAINPATGTIQYIERKVGNASDLWILASLR